MLNKFFLTGLAFVLFGVSLLTAQNVEPDVKVYYFHLSSRCETCMAIEKNTREVIENEFKKQNEQGDVTFSSVNVEEETDHEYVKKFGIDGPTLLVIYKQRKKEKVINLTDIALRDARYNSEKFKAQLLESVNASFR